MRIKDFAYHILFCLLLSAAPCCLSSDTMYTQSLSSGTLDETSSNSSAVYTNKEFPQINSSANKTTDTTTVVNPIVLDTNNIYYPSSPYYYNRYPTYRIGPYYSSGLSIGGFNYKGFSYNYSSNRTPIYVNHPIAPPPPPPKPPQHNWNTPPQKPQGVNNDKPPARPVR